MLTLRFGQLQITSFATGTSMMYSICGSIHPDALVVSHRCLGDHTRN